ncbi:MAG: adenine deaminase, partial [Candidatus Micrarchaeota archaeon]|nr:adenine deaminase [Candidatus Micrarchaeota archaeon]
KDDRVLADRKKGILHISVINRYKRARISNGFVKGFRIKGAIASSIAHDSHNIIVVGDNPKDMLNAAEHARKHGGFCVSSGLHTRSVRLDIAGLMTDEKFDSLAAMMTRMYEFAKKRGCILNRPFMQLTFLALTVIPSLKISDKGLFDSSKFEFVDVFADG